MKRIMGCLLLALVALAAETPQELFEKGLVKERSEGNLKEAIQLFERVAETSGKDRALAAKALLEAGECHQKMGDAQARTLFERVIRDYGDQKEIAGIARLRLGSGGAASSQRGMAARQIWKVGAHQSVYGAISPDGRLVPYVNWNEHGDLFVHDLVSGTDRRLTNGANTEQFAEGSVFSRDGKWLAYAWLNGENRYEIRIVGLEGTGVPAFRRLFDNEDVSYISPDDWSPDGKWLAVQLHRKDRSKQIALIGTDNGSLRVLKSVEWRGATRLSFSADGKYLAFDLPASDATEQRDIYLLAIDGSGEIPVVVHPSQDVLIGWSPDGKRLLFASDRSGVTGLWSLAFNGKPRGTPELLKPEIERHQFLGVATSGALYSLASASGDGVSIRVANFDFATGKFLSQPIEPVETFVGANQFPDWSPDGRYLAYASQRGTIGSRCFVFGIRSVETEQTRELTPSPALALLQDLVWAPDSRSLVVAGEDAKGRSGIFRIDRKTGQTTILVSRNGNNLAFSPDGKKLYYRSHAAGNRETAIVEHDLASGDEKTIFSSEFIATFSLSANGRYLAVGTGDNATNSAAAVLVPVPGGEPRDLMRVARPATLTGFSGQLVAVAGWTPDSHSVILRRSSPTSGQSETWLVSIEGEKHKIDIDLGMGKNVPQIRLHPDGRRIAFAVSGPRKPSEVWALENFLPVLKGGN